MSRSSEEVLLIVNKVKNKKCEGSLYMMGQRMAWMPSGKDTFTISHSYADIRVQKISPDSKEKVQLQIVLHDGGANTFMFNMDGGRGAQVKEREAVKELLQQVLPRFRRKVDSELEQKNRMLQEDKELFQLYKDLVVSGVVSASEFWDNRANNKESQNFNSEQEVGVSPAFLADVRPQTDGCNGLKYNLTVDTIEAVFKTYPAVKRKHAEFVPDKVTEQEFWTKFFQSHYFHRDRVNLGSKDMFTECAKYDEQELKKEMIKPVSDPLLDLTGITDDISTDGYGTYASHTHSGTGNQANASLIRRFNQHSTMVLKICDNKTPSNDPLQLNGHVVNNSYQSSNGGPSGSGSSQGAFGVTNFDRTEDLGPSSSKKSRIRGSIAYEDLQAKSADHAGPSLNLSRMDRYLHGPTPVTATQYNTSEDVLHACQAVSQEILVWEPRLNHVLPTTTAVSVLWELSPGGALMQGHSNQNLHQLIPKDIQEEVQHHYSALCELLRHFWSCFPPTSKLLEEKVVRMHGNLERFQMSKLYPLKEKLHSYHYNMNLVGHLGDLLEAAFNKYNLWQNKRIKKCNTNLQT